MLMRPNHCTRFGADVKKLKAAVGVVNPLLLCQRAMLESVGLCEACVQAASIIGKS